MLNKLIVNAYKVAGFVILVGILVGLASYVTITGFYYASSSWVAPVIVSPIDKRVLELNAQLAQQQSMRDALSAQRAEMTTKLADADRVVAAELAFQDALRGTLKADLDDRRASLAKLEGLRKEFRSAADDIASANQDFAGLSRDRIKDMFDARLATKDDVLKGNMELAGLANANLSLSERKVALDEQVALAARQAESMALVETLVRPGATPRAGGARISFASGDAKGVAPTHDVLAVQREFELSVLTMTRAKEEAVAIKAGVVAADATLTRYDNLLTAIKNSPYLKAVDQRLTVAFVPYTNLDVAKAGAPVYACKGNIVWCKKVGRIVEALDGEVTGTHPVQKLELRGVMVRLELDEIRSAQEPVLHVGRAPLFL